MYNVGCFQSIIFYALSTPIGNCNSDVVKYRGSGKCHTELAVGRKRKAVNIFPQVYVSAIELY